MRRLYNLFMLLALTTPLVLIGCGGGEGGDDSADDAPAAAAPAAPAEPAGTASISGAVAFNGEAPQPRRVRLDADCQALHSETVMSDIVVVNDNGTLQNVFVYVKDGLGDRTFAPPAEPVEFDQVGCMYTPHVFGVQVGQTIKILNSDPFLHNIHALPETNRPFNFGMPKQGDVKERSFRVAEVMVKIKCDVHPWMGAWAGVVDHPYHSTTGADGSFSLDGLPAGTYTIEAWHEEYGTTTQTVTVGDGEAATVNFSFGAGA